MHFFQDNLDGAAVVWYTNFEASRIRSGKDLIIAFIRQYQYNTDMAPDRTQLQNMSKREHESFKEYTYWISPAVTFCSTFSSYKYIRGTPGLPESAPDRQVFKN